MLCCASCNVSAPRVFIQSTYIYGCLQGSATLSMAYAGALFADSCLRGLNGDSNVFDYSYVESDVTDVPYFSSRVDLGPEGDIFCPYAITTMFLQCCHMSCSRTVLLVECFAFGWGRSRSLDAIQAF